MIKISLKTLLVVIITAFSSLNLMACGGTHPVILRSANDFNCPQGEIQVRDIGAHAFQAIGCGRRATYICDNQAPAGSLIADIRCTREAETESNSH
jgi:hypothetical protein